MLFKRKNLYILSLLLSILALSSADFEDIIVVINSVSTVTDSTSNTYKSVSLEGGAYLYIKGSGFSTRSASSNVVTVGDVDCPVVEFLTTSTQVVCVVPPSNTEKSVAVKVIVDENRIGACSSCWIYYSYWSTPLLAYMLPNAGNQGQEVSYYGRQRVSSSLDVDYVKIGALRCDPSNQNEFDSVTFDGSYMPAPCNVPENEAGYYNVTQRNLENTGYARKLDTLPVYRPGQTTYDFVVVPAISSISSNIGSPQGQIITITGTGFSSTDDNQVYLAETECKILSQSTTEIQCEVQPRTTPITDQGYHAGLKFAFYNNTDINSVKAGTAGTPTYTDIRLTAEIGLNLADTYSSKLSGFFKAPVTGNYKFVVSADDKAQLAISTTPLVKTGLQTIINIGGYTGYRMFYQSSSTTQFSNDIALTAGNFYYLELYHQEGSGSDYATLGVIIPDNENTINAVPEGRSIKINCPTIYEVIDFKVTATGGNWRIRLDYLSSDGKKIDSTATTSNIAYNAAASTVSSRISSNLGLANTVTRTLYDSTGAVTTVEANAVSYKYTVTFQNYRTNGKLPVIESTDLTGTSVNAQVTQTTAPSDPVRGTFTINANGKTSQLAYSASTWTIEEGLRTLGYTNPIRVVQTGDINLGAEWRIQFTGDRYPVTDFFVTHSLTGCSNPSGISVAVDTIHTASDDLFYEVIPVDYLFTAEANPQITVKSNGVTGNCPNSNCAYVIQSTGIPEVSTASYSASTLTLSVSGVTTSQYNSNQIRVFFGNTECTSISYSDSSIPASLTASCPTPEAGDFTPRVHFTGLGFASIASGVSPITIAAVISSVTPTQVNPNGGSILTITGTGFPASLDTATKRGIQVKVGSSACTLSSVAPTQIVCVSTPVASDSALTVSLNSKTATSSVLTLLTTYPTITSVSPNSVNPVLQTDITITGHNFDNNDITNTKIYLSNSTNSQVTECLPVTSIPTQITCKLLGAPTGSYSLYVQTSLGYSDTQPFVVKTVISSISPSSGSTAGGTILTIQGGSFSNIVDQTLVFIGSANIACDVISSTSTQVKCKTQAKNSTYDETPQEVVLTTRIVEETICDTGATCTFTYLSSLTPTVTALSATSVSAGNNLVITGTGFTSSPSGTSPTVTVDDTACTIVSSTDTSITITVPTNIIPDKTATLSVNIAGKGDALFSVNNTIQVAPKLSSISPTSASTGGALITITGAGFQTGASVKVGSTACDIRSLTSTTITCRASSTGEVSLTYGDFSSVKCSTACTLGSSSTNTPTVTSVSPLSPTSASAFTLTIVGTKFVDLGTAAVNLVSQTDKTVIFAGSVTSPTNTQISAAFTNVAAGSYSVEVLVGANVASSTSTVNVPLSATVSSTTVSSIAGGATLTITGSGFFANSQKDSNKVSVCGFDCTVTQSAAGSIQCLVPLFTSVPVKATYPDLVSSSLLTATTAWSDSGKQANVVDLAFTTLYSSSNTNCQIGFDIGSGLLADISEIKYFPDPSTTASKLSGTVIEGSSDNSTYTNIATIDANAHDGWNTITLDTTATYRYYRLRGDTSTAKCALAELQFYGVVLSDSTVTDLNALTCSAKVTVNDKTQSIPSAVTYKQSQTPTLTSISPKLGTTAGGTTLILTGTGFTSTVADITVLIDDIACTVLTASSTQITCVTGAAPTIANRKSSLDSKLTIRFAGQGDVVVDGITYFYVDKWSDINTWGGITPPRAGESVSIPTGQTILLDTSTPKLKAIIIEGALIFNDQDLTLDAEYILIRNGRLQIGTRANPIQSKIVVTIHGNKESADLPTYGNKVIAMMEGVLDIHGKERSYTWTVLDSTAEIGVTSITVQGQVDWVAGEQIVIASTDHDHYMSETRKILTATVNSQTTTLTFADPLVNRHYAGIQTIGGVQFEMRAEVGLLTRNVVIQGDETSEKNKYGVHIMAHSSTGDDSSIARISYTEVRQAGQAFNLGRYAIHFHLIGNVRESYVIGNAIHHTYNRAVTIHGVHFLKVQKNVAYWVMGHTIFIEDGIETHNVIEDNLVVNTIASNSLLNTDQTPASFWITNPNNIWRRNHAAGSDRYGFWFDLREHPEGPSATTSICPIGEKLGEFTDNVAHSSGRYGLRIFHEHTPRTYPCLDYSDPVANPPIQSEFTNFFGWKNTRDAIIGEKLGAVKFKNVKAADNKRAGIEISDGNRSPADTLLIEDAWIVGKTPDNAGDDSIYIEGNSRGIITPKVDFFLAKNVHFYNFGANMTAIETCSHCEHPAATDAGARTSFFEGLTFSNVAQRVRFNIPYKEILVDRDGSLVGTPGSPGVVTHYYEHLDVPGCTRDETVYNGLVCGSAVTIRRVEFSSLTPFGSFELQDLEIYRNEQNSQGLYGAIPYRQKNRKSWAVPFVTGYSYGLNWASRADFTQTVITPSDVIVANDKPITLVFNHSEYRELFDVFPSSGTVKDNITNVTTLWDPTTVNALSTGSWYHDVTPQNLYFLVNGVNKQEITVQSVKCRIGCPLPASFTEKDGIIRLWSNATQWPNQVVPQDGDDVKIPGQWTIKLDVNSAKLKTLHVIGDLHFDGTVDDLVLTAERIWVEGQLFIGSQDSRYTKNAKVVLTGLRNSSSLIIGEVQDVSNKVLAVTGNVTMYGALVNSVWARLQAPVQAGATTITVPSSVGWSVGDEIVISPTQRAYNEYEVRKITAISGGVITLNGSLSYYHFGGSDVTKSTPFGDIDMRAEVGLLTRNIVVEGSNEDSWGGRIYVGEIYDSASDYYLRGRVDLDGVEMNNFGQKDTVLAGLTFDRLVTSNNGDSSVTRCVVRNSLGYEMKVVGSTGVTVENNLFFRSYKIQVKFEEQNTNIQFNNNLLIATEDRGLTSDAGDNAFDFSAAFYADGKFVNSQVSGNIISACYQQCWYTLGGDCSTQPEGPYTISNNVAHSGKVGWLVKDPNAVCNGVSHFTGYKLEQGVASMFKSAAIQGSNLIITDTEKGISLNLGGITDPTTITLKNSYAAGITPTGDANGYTGTNAEECSSRTGVMLPVSIDTAKPIPPMPSSLPWYKVKSNHIWQSYFTMTNVTFENFKDDIVAGCTDNFAIISNHYASDDSTSTKLSGLTLINVADDRKIYFELPDNGWIGVDDCGGYFCTGINNILVRDLDGSLAGAPASVFPATVKTIIDTNNGCAYNDAENAIICTDKGWGLLTFQSLDIDVLTRIISPVYVTSTNYTNKLNSYMDHVWDGFYTGLKRYSRFHSVVEDGTQYNVAFTGTLPNGLQWGLQGALSTETTSVTYRYTEPKSLKVTNKTGGVVSPLVVKLAADKVIKTTDACGTNLYDLETRSITVQLTGESDCLLSIKITNAVQASIRYSISIDEFFNQNGAASFVDKVAAILGINPASVRVVDIKSGSTIINFFIDSNHQDDTTESDAAALTELQNWVTVLQNAVANGDMRVLDSEILNSSFSVNMIRPQDSTETITSGNDVVIIVVAAVVGVLALTIGTYFAYRRYYRRRIVPDVDFAKSERQKFQMGQSVSPFIHTDNPLVVDISHSPSAFKDPSPLRSPVRSQGALESPERS